MTTKQATCKFCGLPLTVQFDEAALEFINDEKWWVSLAACNHCADHRMRVLRHADAAKRLGGLYIKLWNSDKRTGKEMDKVISNMESLSKRFVGIVSSHYRQTNHWDPGWIELLTEKPQKAYTMFITHENNSRRLFLKERDATRTESA